MRDVELEEIKEYAAEDADITFQLKEIFTAELDKQKPKLLKLKLSVSKSITDYEKKASV
jgi:DNA polymerase-1